MRRTLTIVIAAALAFTALVTPAIADEPDGPVYFALGDSISAGSVANNINTAFTSRLARYLTSHDCNGGEAEACAHLDHTNLAVGGAKSIDLINVQLGPAVDEIVARQSDGDPNNNVEYITVSIGGNDLFQPVIAACGGGVDANCVNTITTLFAAYQQNLGVILATLRAAAPDAEIAIMTYDNPLWTCYLSPIAPLGDMVLEGGGGLPAGLNDIIRGVAAGVGDITVVEVYGLLDSDDFVGGTDCLHPDDSGHRKIAKAFAAAMG